MFKSWKLIKSKSVCWLQECWHSCNQNFYTYRPRLTLLWSISDINHGDKTYLNSNQDLTQPYKEQKTNIKQIRDDIKQNDLANREEEKLTKI